MVPIITLLFYIFIAVLVIQLAYYFSFLFSFALKTDEDSSRKNILISVIICAKNEAENLTKNLPHILSQNYNNFEIVLVNDRSSDSTLEVMKRFANQYANITLVDVKTNETFWGNKKYALTLGIKASNHDYLVFTDADCRPISSDWLCHVSKKFSNEKSIVLGYGGYSKKSHSLLNKLIRFETVMTALQYFSYARLGIPYMGVGRNLAYKKELFFYNSGFNDHIKIKSGDDDLFINKVANRDNIAFCFNKESFTVSDPKISMRDWFVQKRRHVSTAKFYKPFHQFLLGLFYCSQILFWVLTIILFISGYHWPWVLAFVLLRLSAQMLSFGLSAKKFNELDIIPLAPVLELFLIFTQLGIFITNRISSPKHWK